jgi:hypothetical protein
MSGLGKKILSAFVEVRPPDHAAVARASDAQPSTQADSADNKPLPPGGQHGSDQDRDRFSEYFDKLFSEANMPGPDYYEFSKMIAAMTAIPDEQSRFYAAYAGLQAQGLEKAKLLATAAGYLQILETDATHFKSTAAAALQEKVTARQAEAEEKSQRIQSLSREISDLQQQITALQAAIRENEAKIEESTNGYAAGSAGWKARITGDIEKINRYIH